MIDSNRIFSRPAFKLDGNRFRLIMRMTAMEISSIMKAGNGSNRGRASPALYIVYVARIQLIAVTKHTRLATLSNICQRIRLCVNSISVGLYLTGRFEAVTSDFRVTGFGRLEPLANEAVVHGLVTGCRS